MNLKEIKNLFAAFIILSLTASFTFLIKSDWINVGYSCLFSAVILIVAIGSKKLMAYWLDADVEHEIWHFSRYGFKPHWHFKTPIPGGIIFPLFISLFSLGIVKFMAILSYETIPSKYRAARRHGFYSFTEMTDWHNALIGGAGIVGLFILAILSYFPGLEYLSKLAIFYAFSNMLPIAKLDGTQIFFGSRVLYAILATITLIFFTYALFLI